jgi:hypothetical protein
MRKTTLFSILGLVVSAGVASAQPAPAKKKTPPACGVKILPLVTGNSWKYTNVLSPTPPREDLAKIVPPAAKSVTITVKNIETKEVGKEKETVVTLEEVSAYDAKTFKRVAARKKGKDKKDDKKDDKDKKDDDKKKEDDTITITSTIRCNGKDKFEISPESFLFAGEPGGAFDVAFTSFERKKDKGWKIVATSGNFQEAEWTEEILAAWKRSPPKGQEADMGSGRLELERRFVPQEPTQLNTISEDGKSFRTWPKVEKLQLVISGRVFLDNSLAPEKKPCSMKEPEKDEKGNVKKDEKGNDKIVEKMLDHCPLPANWINELYFVMDIGLLQVVNTYSHRYSLVKYDVDR